VLESAGRKLAAQLGQAATFIPQDVTRESDWAATVKAAEALGGLHGLINNARHLPATYADGDRC